MSRAIADSTWFHGSQWPAGNHGIMPDGRCSDGEVLAGRAHLVGRQHAGQVGDDAIACADGLDREGGLDRCGV